jgi:hypothetical protein
VALAGAVIGDNIGFWIGHRGGYHLTRRYGPKVRLDERKLKIARYLFDAHGPKVVFSGRFISVPRTYAAFLAGANRMRWRRLLVANATGAIAWAGACTLSAYLAGGTLLPLSGTIDLIIGGTAVLSSRPPCSSSAGTQAARPAGRSRLPRPAPLTGADHARRAVRDSLRLRAPAAGGAHCRQGGGGDGSPEPGHQRPAARHHCPARPVSVITRPVAPTGPPAQPARRWRCTMCQHQPPCPPANATDYQAAHVVASYPSRDGACSATAPCCSRTPARCFPAARASRRTGPPSQTRPPRQPWLARGGSRRARRRDDPWQNADAR